MIFFGADIFALLYYPIHCQSSFEIVDRSIEWKTIITYGLIIILLSTVNTNNNIHNLKSSK